MASFLLQFTFCYYFKSLAFVAEKLDFSLINLFQFIVRCIKTFFFNFKSEIK